jgi:hypothetical protein
MALCYSPRVVIDGLVLYLDAANPRSTSNSSQWIDISGSGTVLTRNGTPSLTTLGGTSCYRFTTTGQSFTGTFLGTQPTTDCTIETWIYPEAEVSAGDRGTLLLLSGSSSIYMSWNKSTLRQSNYWYSHPYEGYWETGAAVSRNTWNSFTAVWNYSAGAIYQFTNNVKTTGTTTQGNATTGNSINIGQESSGRQFAGGIAFMRVYNRALTDSEVNQNYNALRGRFRL